VTQKLEDPAAGLLALEERLMAAEAADTGLVDMIAGDFLDFGAGGRR